MHKVRREARQPVELVVGISLLDCDVATLDPSEFVQPLHESGSPWAPGRSRGRAQQPDGWQLTRLLRACRERPRGRRAAEQRNELPPEALKL